MKDDCYVYPLNPNTYIEDILMRTMFRTLENRQNRLLRNWYSHVLLTLRTHTQSIEQTISGHCTLLCEKEKRGEQVSKIHNY